MPNPSPAAGEAVPSITDEIDDLIDALEAAGGSWNVIGGSRHIEPYLAFQMPTVTDGSELFAIAAMQRFSRAFSASAEIRAAAIDWAISIGAYYVELGKSRPVVGDGRTVQ